jgi:hypothetical protein
MTRHERRKTMKIITLEQRTFSVEELRQMCTICAHEDCEVSFCDDMPEGTRRASVG